MRQQSKVLHNWLLMNLSFIYSHFEIVVWIDTEFTLGNCIPLYHKLLATLQHTWLTDYSGPFPFWALTFLTCSILGCDNYNMFAKHLILGRVVAERCTCDPGVCFSLWLQWWWVVNILLTEITVISVYFHWIRGPRWNHHRWWLAAGQEFPKSLIDFACFWGNL